VPRPCRKRSRSPSIAAEDVNMRAAKRARRMSSRSSDTVALVVEQAQGKEQFKKGNLAESQQVQTDTAAAAAELQRLDTEQPLVVVEEIKVDPKGESKFQSDLAADKQQHPAGVMQSPVVEELKVESKQESPDLAEGKPQQELVVSLCQSNIPLGELVAILSRRSAAPTHAGAKVLVAKARHTCSVCHEQFSTKSNADRHVANERIKDDSKDKELKHACPFCTKLITANNFEKHIKSECKQRAKAKQTFDTKKSTLILLGILFDNRASSLGIAVAKYMLIPADQREFALKDAYSDLALRLNWVKEIQKHVKLDAKLSAITFEQACADPAVLQEFFGHRIGRYFPCDCTSCLLAQPELPLPSVADIYDTAESERYWSALERTLTAEEEKVCEHVRPVLWRLAVDKMPPTFEEYAMTSGPAKFKHRFYDPTCTCFSCATGNPLPCQLIQAGRRMYLEKNKQKWMDAQQHRSISSSACLKHQRVRDLTAEDVDTLGRLKAAKKKKPVIAVDYKSPAPALQGCNDFRLYCIWIAFGCSLNAQRLQETIKAGQFGLEDMRIPEIEPYHERCPLNRRKCVHGCPSWFNRYWLHLGPLLSAAVKYDSVVKSVSDTSAKFEGSIDHETQHAPVVSLGADDLSGFPFFGVPLMNLNCFEMGNTIPTS
jgi:hypothetical protein